VKQLIQLQKKARERAAQDVFVVEGIKMFREVPASSLVHTYVSESFYEKNRSLFSDMEQVTLLSDRVFESVSDTKTPQGILCLVRQQHYQLDDLLNGSPLLMVLENLQDPGNLGTILRTAEGAGVTGILMSSGCVDIYNPKVIRSTMGSIYRMPFFYSNDWAADLRTLKQKGVLLYAAHLQGSADYEASDYTRATAFLIGNESRGLTEETAAMADIRIRIPMCGQVESLNAAIASAILMYEAGRQRRQRYKGNDSEG
jgi:TrmH family RNA methyltransferase